MTTNKSEAHKTAESTAAAVPCDVLDGQLCDFHQPHIDSASRCTVCKEVAQWVRNGAPLVGVREISPCGAVIFPASHVDDVTGAVFTLDVALSGEPEIRRTIEDVLRVIDNVWIEEQRTQTLLQVKPALPGLTS
ncbi:MAG: hypothetical protein ABI693_18590 [Bryobacteraceae bacterium]